MDKVPVKPPAKLADIRVVLLATSHPGNIGAAARAAKVMGVSEFWLVAPKRFPSPEADAMASGALDVLARAKVVNSLAEAVTDCQWVVGTSARRRWFNDIPLSPRGFAEQACAMREGEHVALVFGRERIGLTNEEVDLCHALVEIPANPEYSSLNVANAVQVLCYELRVAALAGVAGEDKRHYPTAEEIENFYEHLQKVLLKTGFLDPGNPRHLMRRLRQLYGRIRMDENELSILRGILTSVETPKKRRPPKR
ncbi:MAG: RNA methyltransferase [Nevskiales bacterium]